MAEREESDSTLLQEKTRLAKLQANKLELEIATMKGHLLLLEDVERVLADLALSFRAKMLSIPSKIAPALALEKDVVAIEDALRKEIKEALDELSRVDAGDIARKQRKALQKHSNSHTATARSEGV